MKIIITILLSIVAIGLLYFAWAFAWASFDILLWSFYSRVMLSISSIIAIYAIMAAVDINSK